MTRFAAVCALLAAVPLSAQTPLPPLPDSAGWGVHVLAAAEDPRGGVWVGTYGHGIFHLAPDGSEWRRIRADTAAGSIAWDFVHAFGFGPRGQVWYGSLGNGWGLSTDGGRTWRTWTFDQLGPEWQYVAPDGIVTRGDTTIVATADGLQVTTDDGAHWTAIVDSTGPAAKGPADTAVVLLPNEYVLGLAWRGPAVAVRTLRGTHGLAARGGRWTRVNAPGGSTRTDARRVTLRGREYRMTPCGLQPASRTRAAPASVGCVAAPSDLSSAVAPTTPRTTWFRRPIDADDNARIDQTYRYGSTMGGNFQQHQGVEFNNPDGTPVYAIGDGVVVHAGRAEAGALTVAIRHDSTVTDSAGRRHGVYSVYFHNSALDVAVGDTVRAGQRIARVGNTGRATNDHLHLEVHAVPDTVAAPARAVVDSLQRFPPYTTNPELWIAPLPGTGIVAGRVLDARGRPVPQARVYGLVKPEPRETPYSFAETYGDRAHPHPVYREHFAVGDVPPGTYVLGVEIDGRRVYRRVMVAPGKVTWVEFR